MSSAVQDAIWYGEGKMMKEHVKILVKVICSGAKRGKWLYPLIVKRVFRKAIKVVQERANVTYTREQIGAAVEMLNKRNRMFWVLTNLRGMNWDPSANLFTAAPEIWAPLLQVDPECAAYRDAGEPFWKQFKLMFEDKAYWDWHARAGTQFFQSDSDSDAEDGVLVLHLTFRHFNAGDIEGDTSEAAAEEAGTEEIGDEEGGTEELGDEEGGTEDLGNEEGGSERDGSAADVGSSGATSSFDKVKAKFNK